MNKKQQDLSGLHAAFEAEFGVSVEGLPEEVITNYLFETNKKIVDFLGAKILLNEPNIETVSFYTKLTILLYYTYAWSLVASDGGETIFKECKVIATPICPTVVNKITGLPIALDYSGFSSEELKEIYSIYLAT